MFKKTMTFDDLNGDEVTQTFYFNYNKKEIAEMLEIKDLEGKLKLLQTPIEESGLTQQENTQQAYDILQDLILDAYGEKGADNVTFVKNPELREYWRNHVAFVELIFELIENPEAAGQFFEKCLPAKQVAKAKAEAALKESKEISSEVATETVEEAPAHIQEHAASLEVHKTEGLTDEEILKKKPVELSHAQLLRAMLLKNQA